MSVLRRDRTIVAAALVMLTALAPEISPIFKTDTVRLHVSREKDGRDCLDHVVVFGERHLRHLLNSYQKYYNEARTHLSLQKDAPIPRAVQTVGRTLAMPVLGGLHHQYFRA
jgi:hypothetical protein